MQMDCVLFLFVCVAVLQPSQQLMSCRAGQLPINTVPGQACYRCVITAETTIFQYVQLSPKR